MPWRTLTLVVAIVVASSPGVAAGQNNARDDLLAKASVYVQQFVEQFSNVVAEETLVQETTNPRRKRTLRSDFLLVRFPGEPQWLVFRDVAEVDGKPVRDKEERLTTLFLEPAADAVCRGREMQAVVWIDEETGRVIKTELRIGSRSTPTTITTTYRFDADLGINVPVEMQDWYPDGNGEIRGLATYGRFRRFQVSTNEAVK